MGVVLFWEDVPKNSQVNPLFSLFLTTPIETYENIVENIYKKMPLYIQNTSVRTKYQRFEKPN